MTGNAIREALEPCPFCGEREALKAEIRGARGAAGNIEEGWVECQNCGARGETEYGACEPDDMIRLVQGGWNRRARTAYDTIGLKAEHIEAFRTVLESVLSAETSGARSPAIDFEARRFIRDHGAAILASLSPDDAIAADAEIGRDFLNAIEAARDEYPWLADWTPGECYGELIGDLLDIAFPGGSASSDIVRDVVRKAILFSDWAAGEGICSSNPHIADPADFMSRLYVRGDETPDEIADAALSCLSDTAAGAGPVGEAVAWRFRFKLGDGLSPWELTFDESYAQSMAVNGGEVEPLYARPVEEPGEVERLTRERDAQYDENVNRIAAEGVAVLRAEAAEAALAETREELACTLEELIDHTGDDMLNSRQKRVNELRAAGPLPKTEADPARLTEALHDLLTRPTDPAARQRARAALSTQESSEALAGDGKEVAR